MNTVIFYSENAVFKFALKEVTEYLIASESEYDPDEVSQLLQLISTNSDETIMAIDDHHYFGYVALDLISQGMGTVTCNICGETYEADQLKEFAVGHGKSLLDINQDQKGGFRLLIKSKMPSMFGGRGYECPEGHKLISMETWKT